MLSECDRGFRGHEGRPRICAMCIIMRNLLGRAVECPLLQTAECCLVCPLGPFVRAMLCSLCENPESYDALCDLGAPPFCLQNLASIESELTGRNRTNIKAANYLKTT